MNKDKIKQRIEAARKELEAAEKELVNCYNILPEDIVPGLVISGTDDEPIILIVMTHGGLYQMLKFNTHYIMWATGGKTKKQMAEYLNDGYNNWKIGGIIKSYGKIEEYVRK